MCKVRCLTFIVIFGLCTTQRVLAQLKDTLQQYTHADSLHGMPTPLRTGYDALHYDLVLKVDIEKRAISGYSDMLMKVVTDMDRLQIDLYQNLLIDSILIDHIPCKYTREANAIFITLPVKLAAGSVHHIKCCYNGIPHVAVKAPWDGGFVWQHDFNDKPWLGVACQLNGASIWWPCKDLLSDEPDNGVDMYYDVPEGLKAIGNGTLISVNPTTPGRAVWHWRVTYPINLYDVTLNVADYAHLTDSYINTQSDTLHLDYYVLKGNEYKAKTHFQQVKTMLACFEKNFGPYPFYRDGYKLCESSYWGMEHQSCVAYGNNYKTNGFGFDFIIIHESAHEWWGNNLSASDNADDWLHESFATYAEALYVECMDGYAKYTDYLKKQKWMIMNKHPIIGQVGVYYNAPDNDMYYKGAWMIHTFRSILNNDTLFTGLLHHLQIHFGYITTNTDEVVSFVNQYTHSNYTAFFNQFLRHGQLPVLQYKLRQKGGSLLVEYRWQANEAAFNMPCAISSGVEDQKKKARKEYRGFNHPQANYITIYPTTEWQTITLKHFKKKDFKVNEDKYLVKVQEL